MDLLDSLDLETAPKNCHRVRSWYLYEQFKSLEKNQLDAARRLKSKSCQDKMLHQELHDRRVRRRLCDQLGSDNNKSRYDMGEEESSQIACASADNIFESLCELETENGLFNSDTCTRGELSSEIKLIELEPMDVEEHNLRSVFLNNENNEGVSNNIKEELDLVNTDIVENINLQLEIVKENIECLEKYAKLCDDSIISDLDNHDSLERSLKDARNDKFNIHYDNSLLMMWSKLVTFAYEIIKSNHGDILQPYVSPIRYNPSGANLPKTCIYCRKQINCRSNIHEFKCDNRGKGKYSSENDWQYNYQNKQNELKFRSEQGHIEELSFKNLKEMPNIKYNRAKFVCKCWCLKKVFVRLLQLSELVNDILEEVTD